MYLASDKIFPAEFFLNYGIYVRIYNYTLLELYLLVKYRYTPIEMTRVNNAVKAILIAMMEITIASIEQIKLLHTTC